ncbi:MAG TPA: hypothetical protein VD902_15460, partial [Symbiobacteriaceae bacterium]|nr:hypothetical protein [Symbiobacteriaceae bacterium]
VSLLLAEDLGLGISLLLAEDLGLGVRLLLPRGLNLAIGLRLRISLRLGVGLRGLLHGCEPVGALRRELRCALLLHGAVHSFQGFFPSAPWYAVTPGSDSALPQVRAQGC